MLNIETVRECVSVRHWGNGESLRSIERSMDLANGALSKFCITHGIDVRGRTAQVRITARLPEVLAKHSGENHWCWGKKRPDAAARMRANNPTLSAENRAKAMASRAPGFREKPTHGEAIVVDLLKKIGASFEFQHVVGPYAIDIAFPEHMIALEIDGKSHDRPERIAHDIPRDRWLIDRGWKIFRVRQYTVENHPRWVLHMLVEHVPGLQLPGWFPAPRRKYRVLIRDAQTPAGRKVQLPNRAVRAFTHSRVDPAPTAAVS